MLLYRRLLHALDNHGLRGSALRALKRVRRQKAPTAESRVVPDVHPFDQLHQVDTSGWIPGEQLTPADLYNTAYYGISPSTLHAALERLPDPLGPCTFVDLGCGKGRALLVAAAFHFAAILGVELSAELCAVARRNTASNSRIRVEQADALAVTYPAGPLVVYLYHPFLAPRLRRVLRNLERQLRASPRPALVLMANPTYQHVVARMSFLRELWDYSLPLSAEDAAADRHGIAHERFTLYRAEP
jgi:SAM-dependent methyltransferase